MAGDWNGAGDAVPVESEVHAVELALGGNAQALFATGHRVWHPTLESRVQHDRPRRLLDCEVAVNAELLVVDWLEPGQLERDVGVLLRLEEVGRAEVVVAHLGSCVDARNLDLDLACGLRDVIVAAFESAIKLVELPAYRRNGEVLGSETHRRMRLVDLVNDHLVLLMNLGVRRPH